MFRRGLLLFVIVATVVSFEVASAAPQATFTVGITGSACLDGIDNDLDGLIDFPDDPSCLSPAGLDEGAIVIPGNDPSPRNPAHRRDPENPEEPDPADDEEKQDGPITMEEIFFQIPYALIESITLVHDGIADRRLTILRQDNSFQGGILIGINQCYLTEAGMCFLLGGSSSLLENSNFNLIIQREMNEGIRSRMEIPYLIIDFLWTLTVLLFLILCLSLLRYREQTQT